MRIDYSALAPFRDLSLLARSLFFPFSLLLSPSSYRQLLLSSPLFSLNYPLPPRPPNVPSSTSANGVGFSFIVVSPALAGVVDFA